MKMRVTKNKNTQNDNMGATKSRLLYRSFLFDFSVHKDTYEKLAKDQCKIRSQHYSEIVHVQVLDYIDNIHKAFCIGIPTAFGH